MDIGHLHAQIMDIYNNVFIINNIKYLWIVKIIYNIHYIIGYIIKQIIINILIILHGLVINNVLEIN